MMDLRADLHLHSSCSDGLHPPAEVMRLAAEAGVQVAALSDHDTVAGIAEAERAARTFGIRLVPAVELSVQYQGQDIHVLGYFIDPHHPRLLAMLAGQRRARLNRLQGMLARLHLQGMPLTEAEGSRLAPAGGPVGRPHVAEARFRRGWLETYTDAFRYYIGLECPAYLSNSTPSPEEALATLREAGGVPVLAHPATYRAADVIERFVKAGLAGLEVAHPRHSPAETARLRSLARELGLLETGGSDYHGGGRGDAPPGTQTVGSEQMAALEAARPRTAHDSGREEDGRLGK